MAKTEKKRGLGFFGFMIVYALLFIVAIFAGLRVLWAVLVDYEAAQPVHQIEAYMASFDDEHIRRIAQPFLAGFDDQLQDPEQAFVQIKKLMNGPLSYQRDPRESSGVREVYVISSPEKELGRVELLAGEPDQYGISPWILGEESYEFDWMLGYAEITVPSDWKVFFGGKELPSSYIDRSRIPYRYFANFNKLDESLLPTMNTYYVDNVILGQSFEVCNAFNELVPQDENFNEDLFLDNCSPAEKSEVEAFFPDFLDAYILCLSNSNHDEYGNYAAFRRFVVEGSDIDKRVYENIEGQRWAHSNGDTVKSVTYNRIIRLLDGSYLVDVNYELETIGRQGAVLSDNNAVVFLTRTDAGLRATMLY